jgi:hypothetical protein
MPQKPSIVLPALYGGIIIAAISAIPGLNLINCLCCAGVLLGGALSVFFYKKDLGPEQQQLSSGTAIQLGTLAGVFGAIIGTAITAAIFAAFGNVSKEIIASFFERFRDQLPPDAFDQAMRGLESGGLTILTLVTSLIIDTIFGLLGGLIGFAIWKPKPGMMTQPPQPRYVPPAPPPPATQA